MSEEETWWGRFKRGAKEFGGDTEEAAKKVYRKGRGYAKDAYNAIKRTGNDMDEKSDGWLGDNKWLLAGSLAGIFAVFSGMGSGAVQALIAIGALLLGGYMDRDNKNSLYNSMFGEKDKSQGAGPSQEVTPGGPATTTPGKSTTITTTLPIQPSKLDYKVNNERHVDQAGLNPLYIDQYGNGIDENQPHTGIPDIVHIKFSKEGKVTHMSASDKDGKFTIPDDVKTMKDISEKGIVLKIEKERINLKDEFNIQKIQELRQLAKSQGLLSSLKRQTNEPQYAELGNLSQPPLSASVRKEQSPTVG